MDLSKYLHQLASRTVTMGNVIFKEDQEGDGNMYFVIEGEVSIFITNKNTQLKVNTITPGKFFGELALLKNIPRTASAIVTSPTAKIARLDKSIFMQLAKSDPEFLFDLLKIVLDRLIIAELNVKKLTNAQEG
ncbi:cyclic nucleotide-binding domain-containing protein [Turneriella parva]|uniref:Transcriptional regulator, Crp/Fnr family n=1 Tax=Turneriella parva (strain ATCC BAA-1111 / DSM 21527 / NCTC 11395 / H) TaxID=869212 RepID=I4B3B7_TURPD|nr:cyclic nucleotide-binding domain-containing protein [Turneriella parva]AFM11774.1 putative transcriptional regulator, Crp/Fnr family [Turneriella parva DSM 21527]